MQSIAHTDAIGKINLSLKLCFNTALNGYLQRGYSTPVSTHLLNGGAI